jgi:hypothetical protein
MRHLSACNYCTGCYLQVEYSRALQRIPPQKGNHPEIASTGVGSKWMPGNAVSAEIASKASVSEYGATIRRLFVTTE